MVIFREVNVVRAQFSHNLSPLYVEPGHHLIARSGPWKGAAFRSLVAYLSENGMVLDKRNIKQGLLVRYGMLYGAYI